MSTNSIEVSIVIVCMNNLKNLYPCLNSIRKYTTVSYETLVVAYLFSNENLEKVRHDFPWVTFIESNEIRGFSENNNLALKQTKGKYCFVLNDDTEMKMPVIDMLVNDFGKVNNPVACMSPRTVFPNGDFQSCGRPPITWKNKLLAILHLWNENSEKGWTNGTGIFRSYNIVGAAFMIRTDIFRKIGWFDEYYFFCPEDIKVGTVLNRIGYECWVDADAVIIHHEGGSSRAKLNKIQLATTPAATRGSIHFYSEGILYRRILLCTVSAVTVLISMIVNALIGVFMPKPNNKLLKSKAMFNTLRYSYGNKSPKEIFKSIYLKIK